MVFLNYVALSIFFVNININTNRNVDVVRCIFENISILDIAERVQSKIGAEIAVSASNDPRSYRQDSSKLRATGFQPSHSVADAIAEIAEAFAQNNLPDGDACYTVKWMQGLKL